MRRGIERSKTQCLITAKDAKARRGRRVLILLCAPLRPLRLYSVLKRFDLVNGWKLAHDEPKLRKALYRPRLWIDDREGGRGRPGQRRNSLAGLSTPRDQAAGKSPGIPQTH